MRYGLAYAANGAPAAEPMSTAEAKLHLRVDASTDDALIGAKINAVRQDCENFTGRQLITATWEMYLDAFPETSVIYLPRPPAQSITSIIYINTSGVSTTWTNTLYALDIKNEPARLYPAYGESWPSTRDIRNAVTIKFKAGYGDAATFIPEALIDGMKLWLGTLYENRDIEVNTALDIPEAVLRLWRHYRVWEENE